MNGPVYLVALLFGVVAWLRALTAPAVVATAIGGALLIGIAGR